jgi:hypothetical protein
MRCFMSLQNILAGEGFATLSTAIWLLERMGSGMSCQVLLSPEGFWTEVASELGLLVISRHVFDAALEVSGTVI